METQHATRIAANFWPAREGMIAEIGMPAELEVERDEHGSPGGIAIHTFVDGRGSKASYSLCRESAILFASEILSVVSLAR